MTVSFDLSGFTELLYLPTGTVLWRLFFWYFGWMPVAFVMLWGIIQVWLQHRRELWGAKQKYIILAIDVPRNNAQSLRAVENLFIYFGGAHGTFSLIEKWWEGKFQVAFSFEVISLGGYIQFLIRTPIQFRNLVETAIYSQYPDAEVYEIEDYVEVAPNRYPNEEYDIWGSEFVQVSDQVLPIRTYPEFEHQFGPPETHYKDPMASLMDLMSSLREGEQLWYQIIVIPTDQSWTKGKDRLIAKILKEKPPATQANKAVDKIVEWMGEASEQVYQLWGDIGEKKKEAEPLKMLNLKPDEKLKIEAAERKVAKLGFEVCIRAIYLGRKDVINKPKAVNGFVGYIKQFNTGSLNALKPDTKITMTSANYFFSKQRIIAKKNKIMRAYKIRSDLRGRKPWILNVEELATLWHFPVDAVVKAPLIQRASARRVEPPMYLPFGADVKKSSSARESIFDENYIIEEPILKTEVESINNDSSAKKTKRPGFMEEVELSNHESGEAEVETTSSQLEEPSSQVVNQRGAPPPNLPIAD